MRRLLPIVFLSGCYTLDLSPEWELDRLRLLALRAEPAEPRPGDTVTFESLRFVPGDAEFSAFWGVCVGGDDLGCTGEPVPIGVEPGLAPQWVVPDDALVGLSDEEALEGVSALVQVLLSTEDDDEIAMKRIPVSLATTPNNNPDVAGFRVQDIAIAEGTVVEVKGGDTFHIEADLLGPPEVYDYLTSDGVPEQRVEEPFWRWYATAGTLEGGGGDDPETTGIAWTAPDELGPVRILVIALDGRGGMGWRQLDVAVR